MYQHPYGAIDQPCSTRYAGSHSLQCCVLMSPACLMRHALVVDPDLPAQANHLVRAG